MLNSFKKRQEKQTKIKKKLKFLKQVFEKKIIFVF